jgi:hypothetical protein
MARITPSEASFNISDPGFYLDGKLTALVDGSAYDFMGRNYFTTGFFRDNIGFGIISVEIELNTNLNPIITITFKDLYGNTMFGKKKTEDDSVDYKVLFNWPPPKFLYTFKGYLGSQVSWLLTLKQTSVTYQSDGSYDIKCEFVPNQWGFMADLPFLFLLAVKGLRKKELNDSDFKEVRSIFDLIKIGRKVEVKSQQVSAEFDILLQQMTLLKSSRIVEALVYSRVIKLDEAIDGTFGRSRIKQSGSLFYKTITIVKPDDDKIDTLEKIKAYTSSNAEALRKVNVYLLLNAEFEGVKSQKVTLGEINFDSGGFKDVEIKQRIDIINNNIKIIQDTIKDRLYKTSKSQLRQITIGEIFQQLAKDSGYLMGRILRAGEKGYLENYGSGDVLSDRDLAVESEAIINKHFPLMIKGDDKEEVPAEGYGVEKYEMAFVNQFITAVSEGVAKDLMQVPQQQGSTNQQNSLIKRINNVEGPKGNPYKPFFRNIAQNVLARAGIIAFLTRSNDPNYPGDYDAITIDRESVEEVLTLAASDMENISPEMLSELDENETIKLKQFCTFWKNFCSPDGLFLLNQDGSGDFDGFVPRTELKTGAVLGDVTLGDIPTDLMDRLVIVDAASNSTKTLGAIYDMTFGTSINNTGNDVIDSSNVAFIDRASMQSQAIYNNGILYRVPLTNTLTDDYSFVLFEGTDSTKVRSVNNANSDGEARNADPDASSYLGFSKDNLLGYVPIDTFNGSDGNKLPRIEFIQKTIKTALLKYSAMSNPVRDAWSDEAVWLETCVYPSDAEIVNANTLNSATVTDLDKKIPASNITAAVAFHPYTGDKGLVFGPFYNSKSGRNHLACINKMCVSILGNFQELEVQKNQLISDILGQAEGGKTALYKQFNILYHQWDTLLFKDANNDSLDNTYDKIEPDQIVSTLEERFGGDTQHRSPKAKDRKLSVKSYNNCTFVYDYPLNNTTKLNVKNSIINIEPLYRADSNTTVFNIIQQVCQKNNFMFIPIPGNGDFNDCTNIFKPQISHQVELKNLFYIMFVPTPESRTRLDNSEKATLSQSVETTITDDVMEVQIGSPYNKIFTSIDIETYENKATAESIVNLQRLTDNENQNKQVTSDCSLLPVMEGRSCKTTFEMIGNAQIFPMQYFYLNSIPLFNGIYQTLKVNHSITPNSMTTKAQGVRMRFAPGESGGIQPITLETFEKTDVTVEQLETSPLKDRGLADRPPPSTPSDSGPVGSGGTNVSQKSGCPVISFKVNDTSKRVGVDKVYKIAKSVFPELSNEALSGMLGHFRYEGQFNPTAFNDTGGGCGALGIAQWRANRMSNLEALAKKEGTGLDDINTQIKFIKQEMTSSYKKVWNLLKTKGLTLRQYTAIVHISFGLGNSDPNNYYESVVSEATYTKAYEDRGGKTPSTIPKRYKYAQEFFAL